MRSRLPTAQRRKVAQLYKNAAIQVSDIAKRFGISQGLVTKIADEFRCQKRRPGRTYGNLMPDCGGMVEHRLLCRSSHSQWISQTYRGAW